MDREQQRQWLLRGVVLLVVFAGAVSMHMERLRGWGFLVACFVAGSVAGLGYLWVRKRIQFAWNRLSNRRKAALIVAGVVLFLAGTFISNYGKPDAVTNNILAVGGIIVALLMWGLYHLFSRLIDSLWARFTNR